MKNKILMDLNGFELTHEETELLTHPMVAGIVLFTRNYQNKEQLKRLCKQIHSTKRDLLIAVDYEGGRVQRFRDDFTLIPPASYFGKRYDENPNDAKNELIKYLEIMISELEDIGINVNFAPVLDLNSGLGTVIGDRAYHNKPEIIIDLMNTYIKTVRKSNVLFVGKHFPGHGSIAADTHNNVAVDTRDYKIIAENDLLPFKEAISAGIQGIMSAHVIYSEVDPIASTFSRLWLQNILRDKLGFNGYIFSDDLNMSAAGKVGDFNKRTKLAFDAGCDFALICNNRSGLLQVLKF